METSASPVSSEPVEIIERTTAFDGYFRVERYRLRHRLYRGGMGPEIVREVFERGQVAAVLPVDPQRDEVVLIEQFRIGAYAVGWDPWLLEGVAGIIEPGEDAESVCRREAREEADCELTELVPIAHFISSPGAVTETVHLYCGRTDSTHLGGVFGLAEEGEDIMVKVMRLADALELLENGRIVNAKTIIALQWLALHYQDLKRRWLGDC